MRSVKKGVQYALISLQGGIVKDCSGSLVSFLGRKSIRELINKKISSFFPQIQSGGNYSEDLWNQYVDQSSDAAQTFAWKFISASGKEILSEVTMVAQVNSTSIIIKPHKDNKKVLDFRNQEGLLININQKIEEGIYRSSMEFGFYYVNRAFVKIFGFASEDEVLTLKADEIHSLYEIRNEFHEVINVVRKNGYIRNQEVLFKRKDGSRFWGLHSCYLHTETDGSQFLDGIIIDITPIKESETLMKEKNRELQKIKEEMDRFVYSISHDLRAPLSSVLGLLNLAEVEKDSSQLSLFIQMMKKSVKRLDHFINEILDYSRNARLKIEDDKIDFEKLIHKVIKTIEYVDGFSRIRKSVKVYAEDDFVTDKKRVIIILTNLITNSVLYHDKNKKNQFIEVNVFIDNKQARLEVIDNGKGIPASHLDKIFQMFYRASEDSKGAGLGLFMVKECVEKLEGRINVSSTLGVGTKFEIFLRNFKSNRDPKAKLLDESNLKTKSSDLF